MTDDGLAYIRGMEQLVRVVQQLALVRDVAAILAIVRRAARELTGADGASVVLRDADHGYRADEDAIAPGDAEPPPPAGRIGSWALRQRETVALDDAAGDDHVPAELRASALRSLVTVPLQRLGRSGAITAFWTTRHRASDSALRLLDALGDATAVAMSNVELWTRLETRLTERAAQLEATNRELEAFSYAVSHDLRAPLRAIRGFSQILVEDHADSLGGGRRYLDRIRDAAGRMAILIDDLLRFSQLASSELDRRGFDLAAQARDVVDELRAAEPDRQVDVAIPAALPAHGDARLVRVVVENLLRNAWKFTARRPTAQIEVGARDGAFFVRDNGAGFDAARADKLFTPFHREHAAADFEGHGVGLATAQRVVHRHGGRIWADSAPDRGATFYFTLG
ncbi:MAG TPA: ATP-binding protein [Kofleriaceae bacterium]|nr:ATP-binding protein [Kofleriaceae bacterium]